MEYTEPSLQLLPRKAVGAITEISRFEHNTPFFRQLNILNVHDLCESKFCFKYVQILKL